MNIDRALPRNVEEHRLQDARAEYQAEIGVDATHKIKSLGGVDVESNEKFGSIGLAGRVQIVEPIVGVAIRLLRSRVNEADYRIQQASSGCAACRR